MAVAFSLAPLLERTRGLYAVPLGRERFDAYVRLGSFDSDRTHLPISVMNPMGKHHVAEYVEQLIGFDAEAVAFEAGSDACAKLAEYDDTLRLAVVVADDLHGGWTNRAFTEFNHRFERAYEVRQGWAVALMWTSETPSAEIVRQRTIESFVRTLEERHDGPVISLRTILAREGRAMRHALARAPRYDAAAIAQIGAAIEPHNDSTAPPIVMTALYGDAVGASLGYPPLGLPEHAGYELAYAREMLAGVR